MTGPAEWKKLADHLESQEPASRGEAAAALREAAEMCVQLDTERAAWQRWTEAAERRAGAAERRAGRYRQALLPLAQAAKYIPDGAEDGEHLAEFQMPGTHGSVWCVMVGHLREAAAALAQEGGSGALAAKPSGDGAQLDEDAAGKPGDDHQDPLRAPRP